VWDDQFYLKNFLDFFSGFALIGKKEDFSDWEKGFEMV
jgi:hypothetical protein